MPISANQMAPLPPGGSLCEVPNAPAMVDASPFLLGASVV